MARSGAPEPIYSVTGPSVSVTKDGGNTFNRPLTLGYAPPTFQSIAFPPTSWSQVAVQNNNVYVIWDSFLPTPLGNPNTVSLAFSRSVDGGGSFGKAITLGNPVCNDGSGCFAAQVAAAGSGVYAAWADDGDNIVQPGNRIRFVSSMNSGQDFTQPADVTAGLLGGFSSHPKMAVTDRNVYLTWLVVNAPLCTPGGLVLIAGSPVIGQGVLFGNAISLNEPPPPPVGQPCQPLTSDAGPGEQEITAQGNTFYAVWSATTSGPTRGVYFTSGSPNSYGGVDFTTPLLISSSAGNAAVPQVAVDGSDIYIVWQDTLSGAILLSTSTDGGRTWNGGQSTQPGRPISVSNTPGPSQAPQLVAAGGNAYIVWADGTPGNQCIRLAGAAPTANGPTIQTSLIMNPVTTFGSNSPRITESGGQIYVTWWDNSIWLRASQPVSIALTLPPDQDVVTVKQGVDAKTIVEAHLLAGFAQPISFSAVASSLPLFAGPIALSPSSCIPAGITSSCTVAVDIPTSAATLPKTYNTDHCCPAKLFHQPGTPAESVS